MTATAEPPVPPVEAPTRVILDRADGIELLGDVHGSGYVRGAALVRRADGQVVQLGPLMYALLECIDGRRDTAELAEAMCERLGRACDEAHVVRLAEKLAAQGLLAGHEHLAPPRRNPLLALRWKVLVTSATATRHLTAPFTFLFRPWLLWPIVASFGAVAAYLLFVKGLGSATHQAFQRPGLLLLVFVLAVLSAGFHELGHAAACRYGGATPGGMGMGIYLVWPAFYTDVTDAYRLPQRDRLRVDLGGLYFNAVVAVVTFGVWLAWRRDALLLLVAVQLLIMVRNLSPVIRSDGYHVLSDATGVPDLYAHIGPTLRRLLPWRRREPSALTGRARLLVTVWVLVVVPVLLALMLGAVLLLPRLAATAWDSGRTIASAMPHEGAVGVLASLLRLVALSLPLIGSVLVTQRLVRGSLAKGLGWSAGRPLRRALVVAVAAAVACGAAWAWWPSGQYRPVGPHDRGTLFGVGNLVAQRDASAQARPARAVLTPGTHLAVAMIPVGGPTKRYPAVYFLRSSQGRPPVAILSTGGRAATAFPFQLPSAPGPGGTQAVAVNTTNGSVLYKVAYALVTVTNGSVTNTNGAFAFANCTACTTVAVSFQVVLVVGQANVAAPVNAAGALNGACPACTTTALADQIVVTLTSQPTQDLVDKLEAALKQLDALPALGADGTPAAVAAALTQVQQQIESALQASGLLASGTTTSTTATATTAGTTTAPATSTATTATTTRSSTTTQTSTAQTTSGATTGTTATDTTTTGTTTTAPTTTG